MSEIFARENHYGSLQKIFIATRQGRKTVLPEL